MRLDGRIKTELRQSRRLGQTVQQALQLACLGPGDLFTALASEAEGNPFVRLQPPPRPVHAAASAPSPAFAEPEAPAPGLIEHVLRQVEGLVARKEDRRLARALIEELDATGYLAESPARIAQRCGVAPERLEAVLQQMRRAEPAGLFARDLADCLALQLHDQGALTPEFRRLLARLPMIASGDRQDLARHCEVSPGRLGQMLAQLRALDPRPGAAFGWHPAPSQIPELLVLRGQTDWEVQLNPDCQPRLTLDQALHHRLQGRLTPDLAAAWTRARHLARALELRNRSVLAVGRCIITRQAGAIAGTPASQAALTRREVAAEVALHETTVGRIVKHVAARIDGRTVPLSQFFGRASAVDTTAGPISRHRLQALILTCLAEHAAPGRLTDAAITDWLACRQITVARRTVAKYRQQVQPRGNPAADQGLA